MTTQGGGSEKSRRKVTCIRERDGVGGPRRNTRRALRRLEAREVRQEIADFSALAEDTQDERIQGVYFFSENGHDNPGSQSQEGPAES